MRTIINGNSVPLKWFFVDAVTGTDFDFNHAEVKLTLYGCNYKKELGCSINENVLETTLPSYLPVGVYSMECTYWIGLGAKRANVIIHEAFQVSRNTAVQPIVNELEFTSIATPIFTTKIATVEYVTEKRYKDLDASESLGRRTIYVVKSESGAETMYLYNKELGGETYLPDEEDITLAEKTEEVENEFGELVEQNSIVYKFKDRDTTKGKGYIILRAEKSLVEQMVQENTIYEVRYDFDLGGGTLEVPDNCVLDFKGGSFSNGIIKGSNTSIVDYPTHSIFNDCVLDGFNVPFFDVRWFGAKPDYNSADNIGTDNAMYFDRAIKACGMNVGSYVKVIGKYTIASTVDVQYDLNLVGEYHINRTFWKEEGVDEKGCNSLIYVTPDTTAFNVIGRGLEDRKSANLSINGIKFVGNGTKSNSILIDFNTTGAPPRVGKFADCVCTGFDKVLYFHDLGGFEHGTIYGNLTIEKVVAYGCKQFIVAKATRDNLPTLCNLIIRDSNIEQNGSNAIYLENLFGPNIIDNCILENSPNVINATIFRGSLNITNNYFERQDGEYMIKVIGSAPSNCFVTCVNSYRVENDKGLPFIINNATVVNFNTCLASANDVSFEGCVVVEDLCNKMNTSSVGRYMLCRSLNYYKAYTYDENVYFMKFGFDKIRHGLLGTTNKGRYRVSRMKANVEVGDELLLCYYHNGITHMPFLADDEGTPITDFYPIIYGFSEGVQFLKFPITVKTDYVNVYVESDSDVVLGNGFAYKNIEVTNLSNIGIALPNYLPTNSLVEHYTATDIKGIPLISESIYDGLFYSDGKNIRNSDGSLFDNTKIISKYSSHVTFTSPDTIYKIANTVDLGGITLQIAKNCTLDFSLGGTITNGTLQLNRTKILPYGISLEDTGGCISVRDSLKEGQVLYDTELKKQKLWNGIEWVNLDGTALT